MISKYFSNKNSFDLIEDPLKQNNGSAYWYLQNKKNEEYCWNTEVFSDDEIERIKIIGRRLGVDRSYTADSGKNCLDHRRSYNSWIRQNEYTNWIYERLTDLIIENNNLFFNFDLTMIENLQFTYYNSKENGCYKSHVDPINWNLPHNRKLSRFAFGGECVRSRDDAPRGSLQHAASLQPRHRRAGTTGRFGQLLRGHRLASLLQRFENPPLQIGQLETLP